MNVQQSPEHWSRLRSMLLDKSQWWSLRRLLGLSVVDGEELDHTRACTGVMPDTVECAYVCANAGPDFWRYQMDVSIVQVVSSRLKQWYSLGWEDNGGERGSCLDQRRANLSEANLRRADLTGVNLRRADLSNAYLRGADLRGADLSEADLREADLRGADLTGAYLAGTDLRGADLIGANLTGADLTGADLTGADLTGADLRGANLFRADLIGANLTGAKYNQHTQFPQGIDPLARGMVRSER